MSEKLTGVFVCFMCKTLEDISNYVPAEADRDPRIGFLIQAHLSRHPSAADRNIIEWASLGSVPTDHWNNSQTKEEIKKKILEGNGLTGFDAEFYATMDTFKADALKCFQSHGRPDYTGIGCQDFLSSSKELKPNTAIERKAAGLPKYDDVKIRRSFLCEHCPYYTQVQSIERMKKSKK